MIKTKKEALSYLKHRKRYFLDKQLFGRAETMQEYIDLVKKDEITDYNRIHTVGLHIEKPKIKAYCIYDS